MAMELQKRYTLNNTSNALKYCSENSLVVVVTDNSNSLEQRVIKFTSRKEKFLNENFTRSRFHFNPIFIGEVSESYIDPALIKCYSEEALQEDDLCFKNRSLFIFTIVMADCGRSLISTVFNGHCYKHDRKRSVMIGVADSVAHMHSLGAIHGNISLSNIMVGKETSNTNLGVRLLDLGVSAINGEDSIGMDNLIEILPPEMFVELLDETQEVEYYNYWNEVKTSQKKVGHATTERDNIRGIFVTRSFRSQCPSSTNGKPTVRNPEILPYALLLASHSIDIWAFGVVMLTLYSGASSAINNSFRCHSDPLDLLRSATWTDRELFVEITRTVHDSNAVSLLKQILRRERSDRIQSMTDIMTHPFFSGPLISDAQLPSSLGAQGIPDPENVRLLWQRRESEIDKMESRWETRQHLCEYVSTASDAIILRCYKTHMNLLKGVLQRSGADVGIPIFFVLVNQTFSAAVTVGDCIGSFGRGDSSLGYQWLLQLGSLARALEACWQRAHARKPALHIRENTGDTSIPAISLALDAEGVTGSDALDPLISEHLLEAIRCILEVNADVYLYLLDEITYGPVQPQTPYRIATRAGSASSLFSPGGSCEASAVEDSTAEGSSIRCLAGILPLLLLNLKAVGAALGPVGLMALLGYSVQSSIVPADALSAVAALVGDGAICNGGRHAIDKSVQQLRLLHWHVLMAVADAGVNHTASAVASRPPPVEAGAAVASSPTSAGSKIESGQVAGSASGRSLPTCRVHHLAGRDQALLDFERFLNRVDPQQVFAGLKRVVLQDSLICWTTTSNVAKLKSLEIIPLCDLAATTTATTAPGASPGGATPGLATTAASVVIADVKEDSPPISVQIPDIHPALLELSRSKQEGTADEKRDDDPGDAVIRGAEMIAATDPRDRSAKASGTSFAFSGGSEDVSMRRYEQSDNQHFHAERIRKDSILLTSFNKKSRVGPEPGTGGHSSAESACCVVS